MNIVNMLASLQEWTDSLPKDTASLWNEPVEAFKFHLEELNKVETVSGAPLDHIFADVITYYACQNRTQNEVEPCLTALLTSPYVPNETPEYLNLSRGKVLEHMGSSNLSPGERKGFDLVAEQIREYKGIQYHLRLSMLSESLREMDLEPDVRTAAENTHRYFCQTIQRHISQYRQKEYILSNETKTGSGMRLIS
ncbi:hypothetical protein AB6D11_06110 [Vibrio splendidus]